MSKPVLGSRPVLGFLTRSDTNLPLQLQKMASILKFHIQEGEELSV